MRRIRRDATKVWHNPEITTNRRGGPVSGPRPTGEQAAEDRKTQKQHRAALEALFTPKKDEVVEEAKSGRASQPKAAQKIVLPSPPSSDPKVAERQKLLHKLLNAEGRPNVSKAANDFLRAGHAFPDEQDVHLKLLEHADEERVRDACESLCRLLAGELPQRRTVLEARLRRIEQFAEEAATREAAKKLFRQLTGRASAPPQT